MVLNTRNYNFMILFIIIIFLTSCSSSVQRRYGKHEEKKEKVDNSIRFTDDNDQGPTKSNNSGSEFDEEPIEEIPVNLDNFISKNPTRNGSNVQLTDREKLLYEVVKYINTPYQYGGANNNGIDCSAFTQNVFSKSINYSLPRTASQQFNIGSEISSESNLIFGDLIFFNTTKNNYPGHVGIYLGEGLFAHSSSSRGVTISSIKNNYYQTRFVGGRRAVKISN